MDAAYVTALAALTGSAIGGPASLWASRATQHVQFKARQHAHDFARR